MLQNLREHVQGWIAAVIAGILCLAFALWGVEYYISSTPSHPVVAKVDGFKITQDQWDTAYNRSRQSQQIQLSDPKLNEAYQNQLKTKALNGLIQQHVLITAAEKMGYVISPAQVLATLQQMPAFQLDGQFSYPLFQRTLQNLSYTPEGFAQDISNSNLLMQVQRSFADSNFALSQDVDRSTSLQNQKRSFGYFLISPTPFLASSTVKPEAVEDYYKTHTQDFTLPEKVSLQYLLLSTIEASNQVEITEEELKQFFDENKSAFSSTKDAKGKVPTFADVKPKVEKALRAQKAEQWVATQSDRLTNLTYTRPDTLRVASEELGLPIQITELFTQRGEKQGLLSNPKVLAAAFSDNVLKQRNNSDLIQIDNQTLMVLRIAEYKPAVPQPLAEVRPNIEKFLKQQAAQKTAATLGQQIQEQMKKGVPASQLATKNKLSWVQKQNVDLAAKDIPKEILNLVFDQSAPESSDKPAIDGKALRDGSYAVVALNAVVVGNASSSDAASRSTQQKQMDTQFGALDYDLYLADQMNTAKIKYEIETKK